MADDEPDFAQLLQLARQGDEAAVEQLARTYEPELRVIARVRLGAPLRPYLDTVDLVQSVHRSLLVGLREGRFDISTPDSLVRLALTIVRRKVARKWRRSRRQLRFEPGRDASASMPDVLCALSGGGDDPAAEAQLRDQWERLTSELSEREQRLIELRFTGHSTAEAARQLGVDPDVMRVQLSRLRARVRRIGLFSDWL